jgi:uncharacterized protein (DUF362 family)
MHTTRRGIRQPADAATMAAERQKFERAAAEAREVIDRATRLADVVTQAMVGLRGQADEQEAAGILLADHDAMSTDVARLMATHRATPPGLRTAAQRLLERRGETGRA